MWDIEKLESSRASLITSVKEQSFSLCVDDDCKCPRMTKLQAKIAFFVDDDDHNVSNN